MEVGKIIYVFNKQWILFSKVYIGINWRSKDNILGRFGDSWDWKLGFQLRKYTMVCYLFVLIVGIRIANNNTVEM